MGVTLESHLDLLSTYLPTATDAAVEYALGQAKLSAPAPTELFASDVHGEYEAFSHVLRSGCGSVKRAIDEVFTDEDQDRAADLFSLICYPEEKTAYMVEHVEDPHSWRAGAIEDLTALLALYADELTTTDVLEALPEELVDLATELLLSPSCSTIIIESLIETEAADDVIVSFATAVQHLSVGRLHLVGDVYDRGPAPDAIMEELIDYPNVDVQWGNHDIVWMGAALGQRGCIAHVVRNCARYGNLSILTESYGIDILPLALFALKAYGDDPCVGYALKSNPGLSPEELDLNVKIQKAMAILQFKVEAQLIDENPTFGLEDRKLLHTIDRESNTVIVDGIEYPLTDPVFPTVDWDDPYRLTDEEEAVMTALEEAFVNCEKLQRHMAFFLERGSLYRIENDTLMFHACVPLNEDGSLKEANIYGSVLAGRALFDAIDEYVRTAFEDPDPEARKKGRDLLWYLWLGEGSPLFAKSKMATFEIYLIADKAARKEVKNPFYSLLDDEEVLAGIFRDFDMDPERSRIVCGHTPVKVKDGDDPVKAGGKVIIIDGGFSSAYQSTTGIAGFTLVSNEAGVTLATHQPFAGRKAAIEQNAVLESSFRPIEQADEPVIYVQTDEGSLMEHQLDEIMLLADAYRADVMPQG